MPLHFLPDIIRKSFQDVEFPNIMKYAKVFPVYKWKDHLDRENYRPICVLLHMSKIFERLIHDATNVFSLYVVMLIQDTRHLQVLGCTKCLDMFVHHYLCVWNTVIYFPIS